MEKLHSKVAPLEAPASKWNKKQALRHIIMHIAAVTAVVLLILRVAKSTKPSSPEHHYHTSTCSKNVLSAFQDAEHSTVTINTNPLDPFENAKLSAINKTAYECWQFDAVSPEGTQGVGIYFCRDPAFLGLHKGVTMLEFMATWANGTEYNTVLFANQSTIETCDEYTTGKWTGQGLDLEFKITKYLTQAEIFLSSPQISGYLTLHSTSPAHYPDGTLYPSFDASVSLAPHYNWVDPFPSARANAHLKINNENFEISHGSGGHDHIFAAFQWAQIAKYWYSMRFVTGPYTLRYYEYQSRVDGKYYVSAYLSEYGRQIFSTTYGPENTSGKFAVLRPYEGAGIHGAHSDQSTGWEVSLVDVEADQEWYFIEKHRNILYQGPPSSKDQRIEYDRFVGTTTGGSSGGEQYQGVAIGEQVAIRDPS
ncbi:hypothetical protein HYALB_00004551 [Hymenoscyphus albidus]|uniref:Uncharacterized protein n=1 Tax=Hymenoscyphus albidus TaxID=595503 RepID=A0A9N9LY27_9HELO|nr:hypothetical protein HYALB_00004551 [Hymenoscyphus albidus]